MLPTVACERPTRAEPPTVIAPPAVATDAPGRRRLAWGWESAGRKLEQLQDSLAAASVTLEASQLERLGEVLRFGSWMASRGLPRVLVA